MLNMPSPQHRSDRQAQEYENLFRNHALSTLATLLAVLRLNWARWLPAALPQKQQLKVTVF